MQIILFNGPPFSGKDTAAKVLIDKGYTHHKFAQPIDDGIIAVLGGSHSPMGREYCNAVQNPNRKDTPLFNGKSVRELKIAFSEDFIKPNLDKGFFGLRCAEKIYQQFCFDRPKPFNFVISDCGFQEEFDEFCQYIKFEGDMYNEIILVQLQRKGCDFNKDSRSYVTPNGLTDRYIHLHNNDSVDDLQKYVLEVIGK